MISILSGCEKEGNSRLVELGTLDRLAKKVKFALKIIILNDSIF